MQRIGAVCFVGAMATAAALTASVPAMADLAPPADGNYTYTEAGQPAVNWKLSSVCSQASGTRAQPDYSDPNIQALGCVVNVNSSTPSRLTKPEELINFTTRARITDDLWTFSYVPPDGQVCEDGSTAPLTQNFSFSEVTLTGTRTTLWDTECGKAPGMTKVPFSLSYNSPLDPPFVDRFPMNCDYLAGRPSICS